VAIALRTYESTCRLVLDELHQALAAVDPSEVEALVDSLMAADKVFVVGVGRVMLSLQAFAKRLNHLGIHTACVGDINEPAITARDLLVVGSGSGESVVPVAIAGVARRHGARIAHIGSNPHSSLEPLTDLFVRIPVRTRLVLPDEIPSSQVMSSLFEQSLLLLGDIVALMIVERRHLVLQDLWSYHANLE
jgi:6-phospho-3-hexuloisomerase